MDTRVPAQSKTLVPPALTLKRFIKLLISLAVRAGDILRNACLRLVGRKPRGSAVILYYHAVPTSQRQQFARQMDELVRVAKPIRSDFSFPLEPGVHHCAVTFDDGFVSVLDNALPEMEARSIPSTMFVPSGSLGGPPKWIKNPSHPSLKEVVMTPDRLASMGNHGSVTIASHSISHPNFLALDDTTAVRELTESKAVLEAALGKPVTLFSFPHGKHDAGLLEKAKAAGYQRVFTIDPECLTDPADRFALGRVAVEPTDSPLEFRLKALGAYRWMASRS